MNNYAVKEEVRKINREEQAAQEIAEKITQEFSVEEQQRFFDSFKELIIQSRKKRLEELCYSLKELEEKIRHEGNLLELLINGNRVNN